MVQNADAVHRVKRSSEVHFGEIRFHECDIREVLCAFLCAGNCVEIHTRDRSGIGRGERDVLAAPTAAVQDILASEILQRVRPDPFREEPLIVVVEVLPLPLPLRVLLLHEKRIRDDMFF